MRAADSMQVLITGGAGFIGSHLAERLLRDGHEVEVIDNLSTGSIENIKGFQGNKSFGFTKGDIRDEELVNGLVERNDVIYHLAAAVGVQLIADKPVHTIETNIRGTEVVLNSANKYGRRILLASSSEVYGKSEKVPFREEDELVLGSTSMSRWAYACSKAIDEFLGFAFYDEYGLEVIIGRFFNTIGPRQTGRYGMVVPRFVQQALKNEAISIYGTGKQSRCFCYVEDTVEAIVGLMNCKKSAGKVYNIGSTEEISVEKLADKVTELTKSKSRKEFVPYEKAYGKAIDDMMRRVPSVERIKNMTGWYAKTNLEGSLVTVIESFSGKK